MHARLRSVVFTVAASALALGAVALVRRPDAHAQVQVQLQVTPPQGGVYVQPAQPVMGAPMPPPQQLPPGINPQCYRSSGPFSWHCAGPVPGQQCVQIVEGADPHTWNDNYFCSAMPNGFRWSFAGPIAGMRCTQIFEYADPHTWQDNYLCVPPRSPFHFAWSQAGPLDGMQCLQWIEPADPNTWADNYLCWAMAR